MFQLHVFNERANPGGRIIPGMVKMLAMAALFLMLILLFCEFALKPLWHIIQVQ